MKRTFTYIVLALFLIIRYSSGYLFTNISDDGSLALAKAVLIFVIYVLILLTIWINRNNLNEYNVDRSFFFILLGYCILLAWRYFPILLGIFMCVAVGFFIFEYRKNTYVFSESTLISPTIFGLIIFVIIMPIVFSNYSGEKHITYEEIINSLVNANLFGVIFEEFLFRGLLWAVLRNRGLTESRIVLFQAILFWLAHYQLLLDGTLSFWTSVPFVSVILGILVLRSKSLAISTIPHFLYNFFTGVFINPV